MKKGNLGSPGRRGKPNGGRPDPPNKITPPPPTQSLRTENKSAAQPTPELEQILASIHIVDSPDAPSNSVTFGATVTVKDKKGATETLTIVGVDELDLEPGAVSWISPLGKAFLAADMGNWIKLEDGRSAKIVKVERKSDT